MTTLTAEKLEKLLKPRIKMRANDGKLTETVYELWSPDYGQDVVKVLGDLPDTAENRKALAAAFLKVVFGK